MKSTREDWETVGKRQFVHLPEIARRLAVIAIESADVERACKAYKVIHTKVRNRLRTSVVQKLLYTYINLRLLHRCDQHLEDFLSAAVQHEEDGAE